MTTKRESDLLVKVWLQTELDNTKNCNQLIKTMTKFEKETRNQLHTFLKNQLLT